MTTANCVAATLSEVNAPCHPGAENQLVAVAETGEKQ